MAVQVIQIGTTAGNVSIKVNGFVLQGASTWITDNEHSYEEQEVTVGSDGRVGTNVFGRSMVTVLLESGS